MKTSVITAEWSGVPCTGISMHMVPPYFNPTPYPRPSAAQSSPEHNSYFLVRAEVVKNVWISPGSRHQQLAVTWGWRGSVAGTSSVTLTFRWEIWRLGSTQLSTSHNVWTSQHFLWKICRLPQSSFWLGKSTDNADNVVWRPGWRATETCRLWSCCDLGRWRHYWCRVGVINTVKTEYCTLHHSTVQSCSSVTTTLTIGARWRSRNRHVQVCW